MVQALVFYIPRLVWLMMEGGLMKFFGRGTTSRNIEDVDEKRDYLVTFFNKNIQNKFNVYFYGFIMCEVLNVTVAFIVLFLTNKFLNHRFLFYGLQVWRYYSLPEEEHRFQVNPMCDTFPRIGENRAEFNRVKNNPRSLSDFSEDLRFLPSRSICL